MAGALVVVVFAACGSSIPRLRLDGSPRIPQDEGVATLITRTKIVLDGRRAYSVDKKFVSFSTYDGALEPMVNRRNQYVQLGLRGHTAIWMAGIAAVVMLPKPAVYYFGKLTSVEGDRLVFRDGTVLQRRRGLAVPKVQAEEKLEARIDPRTHRVVELDPA